MFNKVLNKFVGAVGYYTPVKKKTLQRWQSMWQKKSSDFDVTMGSFDGAEVFELVGLYLLSQLQHLTMNVGLYRDDALAITNRPPRAVENMKKRNVANIQRQRPAHHD